MPHDFVDESILGGQRELHAAFARRLADIRAWYGYSRKEVSHGTGLSEREIQLLETESRLPKFQTAIKLCNFFHCTLDWLFLGMGPRDRSW